MNVVIKFTTLGADTGPLFDLFSDATVPPFCCAFASNVTKTQLLAGYSTDAVPAGTNYIRVKSKGVCTTSVDLLVPATITTTSTTTATPTTTTSTTLPPTTTTTTTAAPTTTTSTTIPPTTTTTTTQLFTFLFNPTASFPAWNACPFSTYTLSLYANQPNLDAFNRFYTQSNLTNPMAGGGNYFKHSSGTIYAFNNSGQIQGTYVCTTTTTTTAPPTTTTTTTPSFRAWHLSSPSRTSAAQACLNTNFTLVRYSIYQTGFTPAIGTILHSNSGLASPWNGGDQWYQVQEAFADNPISIRVSGVTGPVGSVDIATPC